MEVNFEVALPSRPPQKRQQHPYLLQGVIHIHYLAKVRVTLNARLRSKRSTRLTSRPAVGPAKNNIGEQAK
jgi:hypothetical protein